MVNSKEEEAAPPLSPAAEDTVVGRSFPQLWNSAHFFDQFPEPAWAFEPAGPILAWNHAAVSLFGYTHSDALGLSHWTLIEPNSVDRFQRAVNLVREGGVWQGPITVNINHSPTNAEVRLARCGEPNTPARVILATISALPERSAARRAAREAARWSGTRALLLAIIEEEQAPPRTALPDWIRFIAQVRSADAMRLERGAEDTILMAGFPPIAREVLAAFLGRNGYPCLVESDPAAILHQASANQHRLQLALIGPENMSEVGEALLLELRRIRPFLPIVTCGWQTNTVQEVTRLLLPFTPIELLRTLAERIGMNQIEELYPR